MDPTRDGLRSRDLAALGVDRPRRLPSGWTTTTRGIHVPVDTGDDSDLSTIATAATLCGDANAVGGWAALRLHGVPYFDGATYGPEALVHCLPGSRLRPRPLIKPFQGLVLPDELVECGGVLATTIARAAFDQMRMARTVEDAVVVADMATSQVTGGGRTRLSVLAGVASRHRKVKGVARVDRALLLASERSASPWETRLRLRAVRDVGMKDLLVNVPVFDLCERLLGIADLIDPTQSVVLESDGSQHRDLAHHRDDNEREERFEDAGLAVARFTAADHRDRWAIVGRIEKARRRGRASTTREWTLEQPAWWPLWEPGRRYR